jgi:hypothetical protein
MREKKRITAKNLIPGQEILGVEEGASSSGFTAYVKEVTPAGVRVAMWDKDGKERIYSTDCTFIVRMSEREVEAKYEKLAREIVQNIQNKLLPEQIGAHEDWNGWLYGTPYEMAAACWEQGMRVIGYCDDIVPKRNLYTGEELKLGICAEYEDGERIWCHFSEESFNDLIEYAKMKGLLEEETLAR